MRYFRVLVAGAGISAYGSYLNMVALNVYIFHITGSALTSGLFMAVRLMTSVVSGFVSGRLVSRLDRKRLMVFSDLTQAAALGTLIAVPGGARVPLLFVLAVTAGACSTLSQVALRSSIPEIVGAEHRGRANGLLATSRSLAMVAGFASAGFVVAQFGYVAAFAMDATSFVISATVMFLLPITTRAIESEAATGEPSRWSAFSLLRGMPLLAVMLAVRAADGLGSSSHNVGLPIYSSHLDPAHPAAFIGRFWATWAIGNIVAQRACGWYAKRRGGAPGEWAFALGSCAMSASFILVFSGLPSVLAVAAALAAGVADGLTEIAYVTRLQEVPDHRRGAMFGLSASAENTGFGLGMVVSAALLERYSPFHVVAGFHGFAIALCAALIALLAVRGRAWRSVVGVEGEQA